MKGLLATGALGAVLLTAGCHGAAAPAAAPAAPAASARSTAAVRWWSENDDYCALLRETMAQRGGLLAGVPAAGAQLRATTRAFVAEVSSVAPAHVADSWGVVGGALRQLVGDSGGGSVAGAAVARAAQAIATDAHSRCGLSLATRPSAGSARSRAPSAGAGPRPVRSGG